MDIYLNAGGQFILAGCVGAGPQGHLLHLEVPLSLYIYIIEKIILIPKFTHLNLC
jgi:hypothetical protein